MKSNTPPPLLRGFLSADGLTIRVWCPFCEKMHFHGWPDGRRKRKPENRSNHCPPGSPFDATGYRIAPWRPEDFPTPPPPMRKANRRPGSYHPEK